MKGNQKQKSTRQVYKIPLASITTSHNPRNPLSAEMQRAGHGAFDSPESKPSLWELGTSDDPAHRAEYVRLIDQFETGEGGIRATAASILANGQINPVVLRENGSGRYTLVSGVRRCLAILYNACRGVGKPVVEATLIKANTVEALYQGMAENSCRKNPNPLEVARAYQLAQNAGATLAEIAEREGVSEQTVRNRLQLLELEPKEQRAVAEGRLKQGKALEMLKQSGNGDGHDGNGEVERPPRMRKRAEVLERYETLQKEFEPDRLSEADRRELEVLAWVLGLEGDA